MIYIMVENNNLFGGVMFKKPLIKNTGREGKKRDVESRTKINKEASLNIKSILKDLTSTKSILSRMVAIFLLLIIIPVATIGFIATKTASDDLVKSVEDSVKAATKQTSDYFDVYLEKAVDISMQMLANSNIQAYLSGLNADFSAYDKMKQQQDAVSALNDINNTTNDFNTKILFNNGTTLGDIVAPDDMEKVMSVNWYKKMVEANGRELWVDNTEGINRLNAEKYAFSLIRLLKSAYSASGSGMIIVDINYSRIQDKLSGIDLGKEDSTYLLTTGGKVLSAEGLELEDTLSQRQFIKEVQMRYNQKESDCFYTTDNGEELLVSFLKSPKTGMTSITIVPKSVITAGSTQILRTTVLTGIIFVLIAITFSFVYSLRMTMSLKTIMGAMSKAEKGNLTESLSMKRKDEIGSLVASFNKMLVNIKELVKQNKDAAEKVVTSSKRMAEISSESSRISTEIAHAIVEVAEGSTNQATEVETSVKNVSQLADRITLAAEKTIVMEEDSETMQALSDFGTTTIDSLNSKSAQMNEITLNVVKEINQLNQYVKNINVITNVLRSIADQTNLLALNAAIEAARAGDAGKGFAVVADEIRKLAEQSNSHTREIQKHIEDIFKQAQSSTDLVMEAETSFREQSEMVSQTAEVFSRINSSIVAHVENIKQAGSMLNEMDTFKEMVLSSMENISAVSEEVSASTQEVSASTQEQLATVEQLDDMAKQLNELAVNLLSQMERFKVSNI